MTLNNLNERIAKKKIKMKFIKTFGKCGYMARKNNNALFFTCSLIEYIGRTIKRNRREIISFLGKERIARIYEYADVFHCEPIEKVANEFIEECEMTCGEFDNVKECRYLVPDYWNIGEVYERLIEDSYSDEKIMDGLWEVYYQSIDYIAVCYKDGSVLI